RKLPRTVEDFGARAIEAHHVIPARHGRQTIGNFAVATAELDRNGAVRALFGGDVVERIRIKRILLEIAGRVIDADGPEAVDRNVPDVQPVDGAAVVLLREDIEVLRFLVGIAAPGRGAQNEAPNGIDL